jgi:hypothetical protein
MTERQVTLGAMVDYFSAAFWLPELRSRDGMVRWLDRCNELNLGRLYFRVALYGDFLHHTKLERRLSPALAENYKDKAKKQAMIETCAGFEAFDVLSLVVDEAHQRGMEVVPWITLSDEGVPGDNYTFFAENNPEYLMRDREGNRYDRGLSYAHAAVREYRLSLIREIESYGADGIFLDFTRWLSHGHMKGRKVALTDEHGISNWGYDEPLLSAYRQAHGIDPSELENGDSDWVRFRAEATNTQLLRDLRDALPDFPLYAYVPPRGFMAEMLLDLPTWIGDSLVDQLCISPFGDVPQEGRSGRITYAIWNDFARQFGQFVAKNGGGCRVAAPVLTASSYGPHPDFVGVEPFSFLRPEVQEEMILSAVAGGANEVFFYDLCQEYNGDEALWEALGPVCRRVTKGEP